jgi:predicted MPP superfamily phosphohydrolase
VTIVLLGIVVLMVATALHAVFIAPTRLQRTVLDVPLAGLAPEFDGYTLAVIADVHHHGQGTRNLRRVVRMSNEADPDLVVLLGDYGVSFEHNRRLSAIAYRRAFPKLMREFGALRARDGRVGVLGNHDHYYDGRQVAAWLEAMDVRVLINDHIVLRRGDATLVIGGVGDANEDDVDPRGGVGNQPPGTPIVVLSHTPDGVQCLESGSGIGLVLSGHTHGGQIVIPGYGAPITFTRICGRKKASGWIPNDRAPLYVSRGVGAQYVVRFRCPPELVIVRLRMPAGQQPA